MITLLLNELLKKCKINVEEMVCEGKADSCMSQYMRGHPEVSGILSSDTDIALMSGCKMIH